MAITLVGGSSKAWAAEGDSSGSPPPPAKPAARTIDIREYQVSGVTRLSDGDVAATLYPFLGPSRSLEDVEKARAALEKLYSDRGFLSVTVAIPKQTVRDGVVHLAVTETKVGRLRVEGSHWYLPSEIENQAPSMAEGNVPNFNDIVRDIGALNQLPDRRVTPALHAGSVPGTLDVDLVVQDNLPLHGSIELNNRYSPNTTPLRLDGSIRYDNVGQVGNSLGFSFQIAPENPSNAEVLTGFFLARVQSVPWLTFTVNGVLHNGVSTLSALAVAGKGWILGLRAGFALPSTPQFAQALSAGFDFKRFAENITAGNQLTSTPITYFPVTTTYNASWTGDKSQTQLSASAVFNIRGLSSSAPAFDAKRYQASGNFFYLRADVSHSDTLPKGFQVAERFQGQYTHDPLVAPEQFTIGGVDSVRGYLEVTAAGDRGAAGTLEIRSPSIADSFGRPSLNEWRFYLFTDAASAAIYYPLPDQTANYFLWSIGWGTRIRLFQHLRGSLDIGIPLRTAGDTLKYHPRVQFALAAEF